MFTLLLKALNTNNVMSQEQSRFTQEVQYQFNDTNKIAENSPIKNSFSEYSTKHWFSKEAFSNSLSKNFSKE